MNTSIESFLLNKISNGLSGKLPMANVLAEACNAFYSTPAHDLQSLKQRNTKIKGDIFEYFCKLYLIHVYGLKDVWLLSEIPSEIKSHLSLKSQDLGIDLVGVDAEGRFYAVQAKFRKRPELTNSYNSKKVVLTWKMLSTFYGLCARTGPYYRYIVMTTADYVRRVGHKTPKDITIGWGRIKKISHFEWLQISGVETSSSDTIDGSSETNDGISDGNGKNDSSSDVTSISGIANISDVETKDKDNDRNPLSIDELRKRRIAYFQKTVI